jgi:Protein of unknown function (DUF1559)
MTTGSTFHKYGGFTLVELRVVIAINNDSIALAFAGVSKVRESATRVQCANNLKQINLGLQSCQDSCGRLPPLAGAIDPGLASLLHVQLQNSLAVAGACDNTQASSPHTAGINVALADGGVRFVSASVTDANSSWAMTSNGGEDFPSDW